MVDLVLKNESYQIMGACFEVYNKMGAGFLEAVYQECLEIELAERDLPFVSQPELKLCYKKHQLAKTYKPDFICYDQIILEIKAKKCLDDVDRAQTLNYLKATGKPLGILVNFCSPNDLEYQRLVPRRQLPHS